MGICLLFLCLVSWKLPRLSLRLSLSLSLTLYQRVWKIFLSDAYNWTYFHPKYRFVEQGQNISFVPKLERMGTGGNWSFKPREEGVCGGSDGLERCHGAGLGWSGKEVGFWRPGKRARKPPRPRLLHSGHAGVLATDQCTQYGSKVNIKTDGSNTTVLGDRQLTLVD